MAEPEVGEGNAATRFHQSAWLPPVHKETAGPCVRIVEDGEVSRCRQTPFAALPSMRNLRLKYEEESMSEVDGATLIARSLKQHGIDHLFGVVGFPVTPIPASAQKEDVAYIGRRNEQPTPYSPRAH